MPITAQEFRDMMTATGRVINQKVSEPIGYGVPASIDVPSTMEIINCEIPQFTIGNAKMTSLKIIDGKFDKIHLDTQSSISRVTIHNSQVGELVFEQNFMLDVHVISKHQIKITGRESSIGKLKIEGDLDLFYHNSLNSQELIFDNCVLNSIQLNNAQVKTTKIRNTASSTISLDSDSGMPGLIEFTDITTKGVSINYAHAHRLSYDKQGDQFTISSFIFKP